MSVADLLCAFLGLCHISAFLLLSGGYVCYFAISFSARVTVLNSNV